MEWEKSERSVPDALFPFVPNAFIPSAPNAFLSLLVWILLDRDQTFDSLCARVDERSVNQCTQ
jgi:hypothetical protein